MWNRLTGSWRNGLPCGTRSAARACAAPRHVRGASFTGGGRVLTQWSTPHQDFDVTCPGVTGRTAAPSPLAPYRGTTLRVGSRGPAVAAVQRRVGARPDGVFGPLTLSRVTAFQGAHGLRRTGVVASAEWRAMGAWSGLPAVPSRLPSTFQQY